MLGSHFIIKNDHKPLYKLFGKDKPVPNTCSARVLRWALKLNQFDYKFQFLSGKENVQSDFLSRVPLPDTVHVNEPYDLVFSIGSVNTNFIDFSTVKEHSSRDGHFVLIMKYIKHGCPNKIDPALSSIKSLIPRMTICRGCIMFNDRVFLPTSLRQTFLHMLHLTYPGMVAMKSIPRELVWYPGMDRDIEYLVSNCPSCQQHRPKPLQNSFITWPAPSRPCHGRECTLTTSFLKTLSVSLQLTRNLIILK